MKTKNIALVAFAIAALSTSCRRGDDLYKSPNSPLIGTPATMLVGVEANTFMNYEGGLARVASIMIQHNSGVTAQYQSTDMYNIDASDMDNYWGGAGGGGLYPGAMKNAQILYTTYETANPYYGGIARVLMAMNLGMATQMWGDVPYSEAFQLETGLSQPHYDAQASVMTQIQSLLDKGIADLKMPSSANQFLPGADDQIFAGNTAAWLKTAYTLKARYHNMLSKKGAASSATQVLADLANGMTANTDNAKSTHYVSDQNQWFAFQSQRGANVLACQVLIDSLTQADPRTWYYFDTTGQGHIAVGNVLGQSNTGASAWGPYLIDAAGNGNIPTPLVTAAEALFMSAEAKVRLGDATAFTDLNNAIIASITDVTSGAATGAAQAIYTAANTDLHAVMLEKWKAMFAQPIEAYTDFRRTGFPVLKPRPGGLRTYIPVRMITPLGEQTNNPNAPILQLNVPEWFMQ